MSAHTRQHHIVTIGQSNIVSGSNNSEFRYPLKRNFIFGSNGRVALCKFVAYNSIKNITAAQLNNTFQIQWYGAGPIAPLTITIPDGVYTFVQLNSFLQYTMINAGYYLVDGTGNYVYYLELVVNPTSYALELRSYPIPTALPAGYTNPAGMTFPAVATTPQFIILANGFQTITGFIAGTYPPIVQPTPYSVLSSIAPQIDPNASISLLCNLINNEYTDPTTILYTIVPQGNPGELYVISPPEFPWATIQAGSYNEIRIRLVNAQTNQPLQIADGNMIILLVIES